MCDSCGCPHSEESVVFRKPGTPETFDHHAHAPHSHGGRIIRVEQDVLSKNDQIARQNRKYFTENHILALNLVSSPGSGKTTILEKTLTILSDFPVAVIEGDQQTMNDAERIATTGAPVVQVNTGTGCHLDAEMIHRALHELAPQKRSILFIENVGNLVCPALFDLGEKCKVVIISVTEGDDKPLKYPHMFQAADICLINKTDLLPHVNFNLERCREYALRVNSRLIFFELSATSGQGMDRWAGWLRQQSGAA